MSLYFVEEKKGFGTLGSTSSCIIDARLSLDGTRFDGVYLNLNDNSMGIIAGISADKEVKDLCVSSALDDNRAGNAVTQQNLVSCSTLLGLVASHLSILLSTREPMRDVVRELDEIDSSLSHERKDEVTRESCAISKNSFE
jgi:hypothetical protein